MFPWLTVLENVEAPLERAVCRMWSGTSGRCGDNRLGGLDGFESAYPKELSGE